MADRKKLAQSCRQWADEMHRVASMVEDLGGPGAAQSTDTHRAIADTLAAAADALSEETCWLIEHRGTEGDRVPMWWRGRPGECSQWGTVAQAIRFARREDAEAMVRHLWSPTSRQGITATEHGFVDVPGKEGASDG